MKIRRKIFLLMVACFGISFLILGIMIFYSRHVLYGEISKISHRFSENTVTETEHILKEQVKDNIMSLTLAHAAQVEKEIRTMKDDVQMLSNQASRIISNLDDYQYREIFDPRGSKLTDDIPFILYSSEISGQRNDALEYEIEHFANVQDILQDLCFQYKPYKNSCFLASQKGYFMCVNYTPPEYEDKESDNGIESNYTFDARQRPWYQKAALNMELVFSEVYEDTDHNLSISCSMPYYNNGTFEGIAGIGINISTWYSKVVNFIKQEGKFCFILDNNGKMVFSSLYKDDFDIDEQSQNLIENSNKELARIANNIISGDHGIKKIEFKSKEYYLSYALIHSLGWNFVILTPQNEVLRQAEQSGMKFIDSISAFDNNVNEIFDKINVISALMFFVSLLILSAVSEKVSIKFTENIGILIDTVKEISKGNLDKKVEYQSKDELSVLANSFNIMTENLKEQMKNLEKVTAEKERISTELNVAKNIQLSMLPHDFDFGREDFEIFATMNAAKSVGGDFYDFYMLDENHLVVTIADVSGKGIPAALFMANSKTVLRNFAITMTNPDDFAAVMTCANNQLCQGNDEMMFVTVFMGMLDLKTGKFIFVNGGHNPPMIYNSHEKSFSYLKVEENCVLGMMEEIPYEQQEVTLNHGDILYLYTDGVTEAMDKDNNQYGEKRLSNCLNSVNAQDSIGNILAAVRADLTKHVKDAEQSDDITMLALRRK